MKVENHPALLTVESKIGLHLGGPTLRSCYSSYWFAKASRYVDSNSQLAVES
jgi:hypothetical protein